jgi:hypothetical protein
MRSSMDVDMQRLRDGPVSFGVFAPDYDVPYTSLIDGEQYVVSTNNMSMVARLGYPENITQGGVTYTRQVAPNYKHFVFINGTGLPELSPIEFAVASTMGYPADHTVPYLKLNDQTIWILYSNDQRLLARLMYPLVIRQGDATFVRMDSWA